MGASAISNDVERRARVTDAGAGLFVQRAPHRFAPITIDRSGCAQQACRKGFRAVCRRVPHSSMSFGSPHADDNYRMTASAHDRAPRCRAGLRHDLRVRNERLGDALTRLGSAGAVTPEC